MEFKQPTLIQSLLSPESPDESPRATTAFGIGSSGLSEAQAEALTGVLVFNKMGKSEFERSNVTATFRNLSYMRKSLNRAAIKTQVKPLVFYENSEFLKPKETTIYVIAPEEIFADVVNFVRAEGQGPQTSLVAATNLQDTVFNETIQGERPITGWLEHDNGFFFTVDETMFQNMCQIFGVSKEYNDPTINLPQTSADRER